VRDHVRGLKLCHTPTVLIVDHLDSVADGDRIFERFEQLSHWGDGSLTILFSARDFGRSAAVRRVAHASDLRIEISPFDALETSRYVSHRLHADGGPKTALAPETLLTIYRKTGGVARAINRVCELLLLAGASQAKGNLPPQMIDDVVAELLPDPEITSTVLA
jgi:type II secretory pathway predicted ATPase ExeA